MDTTGKAIKGAYFFKHGIDLVKAEIFNPPGERPFLLYSVIGCDTVGLYKGREFTVGVADATFNDWDAATVKKMYRKLG